MVERLVVVGGGPAGLSAVTSYREAGGNGDVLLISADDAPPYDRPSLSKAYLRGDTDESQLQLKHAAFYRDYGVTVRLSTTVTRLDPQEHRLVVAGSDPVAFTSCVLATGSAPTRLPVPGADGPHIFTLRSLADARRLTTAAAGARRATVVGSGFIGCEAAASLALRGIQVTLVSPERLPQEERLGAEAGRVIGGWLEELGVTLELAIGVQGFSGAGTTTELTDGREISSDLVLVAAGVTPRIELAEAAGLELAEGRVVTDRRMLTSARDVYAAGDIAYALNGAAKRRLRVEHWGEAMAMGEVTGATIAGDSAEWAQAPGFWSTIGNRTVKYVAWGDGFAETRMHTHPGGGFTIWYGDDDGVVVGALTHQADDDYTRAKDLIERRSPMTQLSVSSR